VSSDEGEKGEKDKREMLNTIDEHEYDVVSNSTLLRITEDGSYSQSPDHRRKKMQKQLRPAVFNDVINDVLMQRSGHSTLSNKVFSVAKTQGVHTK
jgi:hypothetical protein